MAGADSACSKKARLTSLIVLTEPPIARPIAPSAKAGPLRAVMWPILISVAVTPGGLGLDRNRRERHPARRADAVTRDGKQPAWAARGP